MKDKIIHLMKTEGLSSSRLADILAIQPSRISHILSGRNNPSSDLLQKILMRFPRINPDWLLLDSPTMYRDEIVREDHHSLSDEPLSPQINLFGSDLVSPGHNTPKRESNPSSHSSSFRGDERGENREKNEAENSHNFEAKKGEIESVIILYKDGTFSTYKMR